MFQDLQNKATVTNQAGSELRGEVPLALARRRAISIILWLLGLFGAIWLLGFSVSVPLFTFLYLKFDSRENGWFAVLLTALTLGFLLWRVCAAS